MKKLKQYKLDFKYSYEFLYKKLSDVNALSSSLLNLVNFKKGIFYTLLTGSVNETKLNEFEYGGITKGAIDQSRQYILKKINLNNKLSCIFDDVTVDFRPDYKDDLFMNYGFHYNKEIYYVITQNTASIRVFDDCFYSSNAIWHSLCVLSEIDIKNKKEKTFNLNEINDICLNTQLIMIPVYDGEGYVFWEKENQHSFEE